MWMSMEPLCKHVCLCAHCNECISTGRDLISPLEMWMKMLLNVCLGFCESPCSPIERGCWPIQLNMSMSVSVSVSVSPASTSPPTECYSIQS